MKRKLITTLLASTAIAMAAMSAPAFADEAALAKRMEALEKEMASVKQELATEKAKNEKKSDNGLSIKWEPAPSIKSDDGRFEMNLRGRIYTDAAWISDDVSGADTKATEFRTARLGIEGKAWTNLKYKFEIDFAGGEVEIKDAYIQPKFGDVKITLGQHKTPNSLEEQTSSRYTTFMERAAFTDAFGLAREIGISVATGGDNWTFAVGAFRGADGVSNLDEGTTIAARATFAVVNTDKTKVHLGGSVRWRNKGEDQSDFRYRQRPFAHLSPTRWINTGHMFEKDVLFGIEAAVVHGPFSVQSEYAFVRAEDMDINTSDKFGFSGGYVDFSYFLTGESRKYDAKKGSFGRVSPKHPVLDGGVGAWQIAYRYDMVDLTDTVALNGGGSYTLNGGKQTTHIVGVNWYWNKYMRMMFDYSHSKITNASDVFSPGVNAVDTFSIRAQVDW